MFGFTQLALESIYFDTHGSGSSVPLFVSPMYPKAADHMCSKNTCKMHYTASVYALAVVHNLCFPTLYMTSYWYTTSHHMLVVP